ncbi:MAG: PAS domain S-box protein [Acidobacteriota bacterium]|nr:PAS domain S-box protein [Acidobacteriota bacterium]
MVSRVCGGAALALSLSVLAGWVTGFPLLRRGFGGEEIVRPNAALGLALAAAALLLGGRHIARVLSFAAFAIGAATIFEYVTDRHLALDTLLFDPLHARFDMRMSVQAAVAVACTGLAGLLAPRRIAHLFAAATGFVGLTSLVAYAYGAEFLPGFGVSPMTLPSAALCTIWAIGYAAAVPREGIGTMVFASDPWAQAARRLSVVTLLAPAIFGAFCLAATRRQWFNHAYAVAVVAAASAFTLTVAIVHYTNRLRIEDERRAAAENTSRVSEALYRTIVETSQEGIYVVAPDRHFTFVNKRLADMLGYTVDEMIGMHAPSVVHPDEVAAVDRRYEERRKGGVPETRSELRLRRRDGRIVHVISSATELPVKPGAAPSLLGTLSDITDRVQSETKFRSIYTANIIGVAFWTFDGEVTDANERFLEMFGLTREQLAEWTWSITHDEDRMTELRQSGRCRPFEKEFVRADGSRFVAMLTLGAIDAETNVASLMDVTQIAQGRLALERAHDILHARVVAVEDTAAQYGSVEALAARLAQANEELETFSYSVSHDLRAPLRAVDGFSRELQLGYGEMLDEQGRRYLSRIRAAAERMSLLIDDLLNLARLSRKPMRAARVDVSAIAEEVAREIIERAHSKATFEVEPGLTATGDPHLLRIVLENLIGNAVKFSAHVDAPHIEVFGEDDGTIAIRDNGPGFDPRFSDKIFAPFQRLQPSEFEGTGIGLALVQRIVRRHGGSIRAEASLGRGATFFFNLPGEAPS